MFSDDLLSLFFVLFVPVDKFVRFGETKQGVAAAAVCVDDEDARRAVEAVFFQHCLMVGRVGGYVDLEEAFHIDGFMHLRLVERVACHFFAGNTPVGVEIQNDGFVRVGFQCGIHSGFEFGDVGEYFAVVGGFACFRRGGECQEVVQGGGLFVCALPSEPCAADEQKEA